ncbi:NEW3 domain-containing protein [Methanoregula sp.]|uniref:NEW3 domain-containing protein n=1 Tax=Methanoregula sp. TaxID=2052170 RepID=UPI00356855B4
MTRPDTRKRGGTSPLLVAALILLAAALILVPQPAAADQTASPDTNIGITCDLPGQIIEAGETAKFNLRVVNNGQENNKKMWVESFDSEKLDWEIRFMDGETEINKISLPPNGSKTVTLVVDTSSDTPAGEYAVRVHIGDGWYWAYVTISKTHMGERGTLKLSVVDRDGEKIKGATVILVRTADHISVDQVMSTADGKVSADVEPGKYTLKISRTGYKEVEKKDVRIKGGITTDAGTVMLEKALFAAEITLNSPVITTTADKKPRYDLTIRNLGKSDDTFRLGFEHLPQGWFVRYEAKLTPGTDISEIFIKSGEEKALVVEAIPPYDVTVGEYRIPLVIDSSADSYAENLTAKIKGSYELKVYADQYQYSVNKGDSLTFTIRITNAGNAGTLTNVRTVISAPDGWNAVISPETIAGIPTGESATVKLQVLPPGNIVASEYKISVKVKSDQAEKSDDFRVTVREQSLVAVFGIALLLLIGGGVYYMFRKYSRR